MVQKFHSFEGYNLINLNAECLSFQSKELGGWWMVDGGHHYCIFVLYFKYLLNFMNLELILNSSLHVCCTKIWDYYGEKV